MVKLNRKIYFSVSLLVIFFLIPQILFSRPKNIIFYIGDGMTTAQRRLPEVVYKKKLAMNSMPVVGMFTTAPINSKITDSAASGTAMATGMKTYNGAVCINPENGYCYETIAEAAKRVGKSVGLVTTTKITDATPAVFVAHIESREMENEIAENYIHSGIDIFMGGGWENFVPKPFKGSKRQDNRDLIMELEEVNYLVIESREELNALEVKPDLKLFGLFSKSHLPYMIDRGDKKFKGKIPDLDEMVRAAIKILKQNPKGFFLMVEGGRIDHACHANDPVGTVSEVIDLDKSVKEGLKFLKNNPDTLIFVAGDHETGGLSLGRSDKIFEKSRRDINPDVIKNVRRTASFFSKKMLRKTPEEAVKEFINVTGISDLKESEKIEFRRAYIYANSGRIIYTEAPKLSSWYGITFSKIISKRAQIGWTSHNHTAHPVILTAVGKNSDEFGGFYDNTDIAKKIARLWGITLRKWKE